MRRVPNILITLVIGVALGVGIGLLVKSLGSSESDKVSDAATGYLQAFADDDPAALCAHITPLARTRLQFNAQTCEQSAKTALAQLPKAQRDALRNAEI